MKPWITTLLALVLSLPLAATASAQGLGLGIILGEPTGVSLKAWLGATHAVDAAAAWSFAGSDSVQLHADYLHHRFGMLRVEGARGRLPVYYGIGVRVKSEDHEGPRGTSDTDAVLGIRVPLGVSYLFAGAPTEIFGEIVPVLDVVPSTDFELGAAIGFRYYFR